MRMASNDETLALAAAEGDGPAFAILVERHYDRIHRTAWRLLGTRDAAEDAAQEVCAALPAKLRRYDGRAKFTTWLTSVVLNAARDQLRRAAARARVTEAWGEADRLRRAGDAARAREAAWLAEAMSALPGSVRETVVLILGEEMTQAEAAAALGVAEGTVAWRMSEAKKTLRALARAEPPLEGGPHV